MFYENNNNIRRSHPFINPDIESDPYSFHSHSHPIHSEIISQKNNLGEIVNLIHNSSSVEGVIPLCENRFFRLVYSTKSALWDGPNIFGNTILHEALEKKDYELVKVLLTTGKVGYSINFANNQGITPLMIAVAQEEESMVELLLNHGARESINKGRPRNFQKTPLHIAATFKNSNILKLLLKYCDANSIMQKDRKGYTPLQRAIIVGNVESVKAILEHFPEVAENLNKPDSYGVTDIQRAARSGNVEVVSEVLKYVIEEEIKIDPESSFTAGDLSSCTAQSPNLDDVPVDQIAFPLVIAQNYCSTMVTLKNGEILHIPNADASVVAKYINEKSSNSNAGLASNTLTLYLSPKHGFLRMECIKCNEDKPYNRNHGLYPDGNFLNGRKEKNPDQASYHNVILLENIFKTQGGTLNNEDEYENDSDSRNCLKIMFYIDDEQAKAALNRINVVASACKSKPKEEACQYNAFRRNCVSFIQEVYESIGGTDHFANFFTSEQLGYGHFDTPSRLQEFQAVSYAYTQSRWIQPYFGPVHQTISGIYQHTNALSSFNPVQAVNSLSASALMQGGILAYAAYKTFGYFSEVWSKLGSSVTEEEFETWYDEKIGIVEKILKELDGAVIDQLDAIDKVLNLEPEEKEDEVSCFINQKEKAKWQKIKEARIDTLCDSVELKCKIKQLKKGKALPSKSYLEKLDMEFSRLASDYQKIRSEFEKEHFE